MAINCAHYNDRVGCRACSRAPATLGCQTWASRYRKGASGDKLCQWCGDFKDSLGEAALHQASPPGVITYTASQNHDIPLPAAQNHDIPLPAAQNEIDALRDHVFALEAKHVEMEERLVEMEERLVFALFEMEERLKHLET